LIFLTKRIAIIRRACAFESKGRRRTRRINLNGLQPLARQLILGTCTPARGTCQVLYGRRLVWIGRPAWMKWLRTLGAHGLIQGSMPAWIRWFSATVRAGGQVAPQPFFQVMRTQRCHSRRMENKNSGRPISEVGRAMSGNRSRLRTPRATVSARYVSCGREQLVMRQARTLPDSTATGTRACRGQGGQLRQPADSIKKVSDPFTTHRIELRPAQALGAIRSI